MIGQPAHYGI